MGFGRNAFYLMLGAFVVYFGIAFGFGGSPLMDRIDDFLGYLKGEDANFIDGAAVAEVAHGGRIWCYDRSATGECAWAEEFVNEAGADLDIRLHTPLYPRAASGPRSMRFGRLAYGARIEGDRLCPGGRGALWVYDSPDITTISVDADPSTFKAPTAREREDFEFAFVKPRHGTDVCYRVSRVILPLLGVQYRVHAYNGETRQGTPIRFFAEPPGAHLPLKVRF